MIIASHGLPVRHLLILVASLIRSFIIDCLLAKTFGSTRHSFRNLLVAHSCFSWLWKQRRMPCLWAAKGLADRLRACFRSASVGPHRLGGSALTARRLMQFNAAIDAKCR